MEKMVPRDLYLKWKWYAIISFCLFLLVSAVFAGLFMIGNDAIQKEKRCVVDVCSTVRSVSYYYEAGVCECYGENHQLLLTKVV